VNETRGPEDRHRGGVMELAGHAACRGRMSPLSVSGRIIRIGGLTLLVAASPGCSFIFTRGPDATSYAQRSPEPDRVSAPACTSSVAAPVVDTALATLSLALVGAGIFAASAFSGFDDSSQAVGVYFIIGGAATGAVFTASAVAGYQRTAACRATLESKALLPQPRASLLLPPPVDGCGPAGETPRLCSSVAFWPGLDKSGLSASSVDGR
jgi:hypothetical protein